jgi:hypothetical protein
MAGLAERMDRHMLFCNKRTMEEATAGEIRDRKSMDKGESQT